MVTDRYGRRIVPPPLPPGAIGWKVYEYDPAPLGFEGQPEFIGFISADEEARDRDHWSREACSPQTPERAYDLGAIGALNEDIPRAAAFAPAGQDDDRLPAFEVGAADHRDALSWQSG